MELMDQWTWNHGPISREHADHLLYGLPDGFFLVRESTTYPGDYTLSVCYQRNAEHYRIYCKKASASDKRSVFIEHGRIFDELTDLIYYYTHTEDNGMVTTLRRCLPNTSASNCSPELQKRLSTTRACSHNLDDQNRSKMSPDVNSICCCLRPPYPLPVSELGDPDSRRSSTSYENSDVEDLEIIKDVEEIIVRTT